MVPLLLAAALVLLPTAAVGASARGSPEAGIRAAGGPAAGTSRAKADGRRKRGKARPASRSRRRSASKAIAHVSGALPGSVLSLDRLDLRSPCNLRPDCSDALRVRAFGEREVEGLVRAADGLYAGAVLREGVGFWIWPRTSAERLTLSPLANPGDRRYGLYITGCFE